jgi:hypothetical protein
MPPAGFEHAIPASKRPQTHALDRAATWIGRSVNTDIITIIIIIIIISAMFMFIFK